MGLSIGAFGLDVAGLFSSHCGPSFRSNGQVFAVLLASCIASWIISWQSLCTTVLARKVREEADIDDGTFTKICPIRVAQEFKRLGILSDIAVKEEIDESKTVLKTRIRDLKRIFQFYAAAEQGGDANTMDSVEYKKLVRDTNLQKDRKLLPSVRIDLIYQACCIDHTAVGRARVENGTDDIDDVSSSNADRDRDRERAGRDAPGVVEVARGAHAAGAATAAYVHYPTISGDMIGALGTRAFNNRGLALALPKLKALYYELFAVAYGWCGRRCDAVRPKGMGSSSSSSSSVSPPFRSAANCIRSPAEPKMPRRKK